MRAIRSRVQLAVGTLLLLTAYACSDRTTAPPTEGAGQTASTTTITTPYGILQDVPAVSMDLPPEPRPWDTDSAALVAVLEEEDGHAVVAFRVPASQRVLLAGGQRAALPAAVFEQGLRLIESLGGEIQYVYRSFGAVWVRIDPVVGASLRNHPLVDYVEPRRWGEVAVSPAGVAGAREMLAAMVAQTTPWGISIVRAPQAWSASTGSGVKFLVIDTGINPHEDLPSVPQGNCGPGFDGCSDGPIFHGTHVSGSALARDNSIGVVGVAHGIAGNLVYSWRACSPVTGECDHNQLAAGIDAGRFAGVKVINMSVQMGFHLGTSNAVAAAWATQSIVLVAAAGNRQSGTPGGWLAYPAAYNNVIGVSGIRPNKTFAATSPCPHPGGGSWASNHGTHVDLAGPFWALSTVGTNTYQDENEGWCGTSMATPHVSGTAALLWAQNPGWTNAQIRDRLFTTAEDLGPFGKDAEFGWGLVNAAAALGVDDPPPPPLDAVIFGNDAVHPGISCTWHALVSGGTPPYQYEWRVDWVLQPGEENMSYQNQGTPFFIELTVTAYFAQVVHAFRVKPVSCFGPRRSAVSDHGVQRRAKRHGIS